MSPQEKRKRTLREAIPYEPVEYLHFALIEYMATTLLITFMAGPGSLGSLIGFTGSNFATNPLIIVMIAIANWAALYAAHATYNRRKAGYGNILVAGVYVYFGEREKRGVHIIFKLAVLMLAELAGCVTATLLLWGILGDNGTNFGKPAIGPGATWQQAFGVEIMFTFFLIATNFAANAPPSHAWTLQGSLISSILLFVAVLAGVPISGASLNWVRHFGAAVVSNSWVGTDWLYYVGPLIGAVGAFVYLMILDRLDKEVEKVNNEERALVNQKI